jgi:N-acetyl-gamma-glutamyl-phosphate reductase
MKKIGIVGFRGYSGAELVQILRRHGGVEVYLMEHRSETVPSRGFASVPLPTMAATAEAVAEQGLDCVFLATPPEVSMEVSGGFLEAGAKVVDLSGAFRLGTAENYQRWYKEEHTQAALLAEAVYALPELNREEVAGKRLISNPGCYPTAASLALAPLVDVIDRQAGVVCDAKSGVSGAGRKPSLATHFCEVTENFSAYSLLYHRHVAEVLQNTGLREAEFSFTAQLLPVHRGILETIYFRASDLKSAAEIVGMYETRYGEEPFIRIYEPGKVPDLAAVTRTNFCDIGVVFDGRTKRGVVVVAIDNLLKGAAGQAVQNMNLALDFPETQGLL